MSTLVVSTDVCVESTVTVVESVVVASVLVELPLQEANKATTPIDKITFFIVCLFLFCLLINKLLDYKYSQTIDIVKGFKKIKGV